MSEANSDPSASLSSPQISDPEPNRADAALERRDPIGASFFLLLTSALFTVGAFTLSWWRWWTFQYRSFDLAFYVQALWLALRGQWHVSLLDVPLLGNHAEPIVFLLLPLFALFPHPMTLVAVQILAMATAPFTARRIALRLGFSNGAAVALALLTLATPAAGFIAIHEFHPEAFAVPLLLLLIEARLAGSLGRFWLWFLLSMACKENVTLMLVVWGAVHAWCDRSRDFAWQWRWNVGPMLAALAWFAAYAFWLSPILNGGRVDYGGLYSHLGGSSREAALALFTDPGRYLTALWQGVTGGNLVWGLAVSFAALPLLRPKWLLIAAPLFLQHLLSRRFVEWSLHLHYAAPLLPLLWIATAETAARFRKVRFLPALPLLGSLLLHFHVSPVRTAAQQYARLDRGMWEHEWKSAFIRKIDAQPDASVSATMAFLPHLAARRELYSLHFVLKGVKTLSDQIYEPNYDPDLVLIDYDDREVFEPRVGFYHPEVSRPPVHVPSSEVLLNQFLSRRPWTVDSENSVTLLRRGASEADKPAAEASVEVLPGTLLTGVQMLPGSDPSTFTLEFAWNLTSPRLHIPWATVIFARDGIGYSVPVGLCAPEVREGAAVERRRIRVPSDLPPGACSIVVDFSDRLQALWNGNASNAKPLRRIPIGQFSWNGEPR